MWDFGQLTHHTEELYTKQIVRRFVVPSAPRVSISGQGIVCKNVSYSSYFNSKNNWPIDIGYFMKYVDPVQRLDIVNDFLALLRTGSNCAD